MLLVVNYMSKVSPHEQRACVRVDGEQQECGVVYRYLRNIVVAGMYAYHLGTDMTTIREFTGCSVVEDDGRECTEHYQSDDVAIMRYLECS